ncbi:hypothetical protein NPD7_689 [Clostridium sporogenes]|nr:hypothetical protein [Clostridium botulinum]APF28630.1 hypothetical protein NPD7_689 [Clostridium sporogenes]WMU96463.1 hypothetical protein QA656_11865 [Clostridium botulinum]
MGFGVFIGAIVLAIVIWLYEYFSGIKKSIREMEQKLYNIEELAKSQNK